MNPLYCLLVLPVLPIAFRRIPICIYPAIFYVIKLLANQLIDFERVRYAMLFQMSVILTLIILSVIKEGVPSARVSSTRKPSFDCSFARLSIVFFSFVGLCICWGVFKGNSVGQVIVDSYKFLEIPVIYCLFRFSWRGIDDVRRGFNALAVVMVALGIVEVFITERGGVGLNLAMSIFPMAYLLASDGADNKRKAFLLLAAMTAIVLISKTRTYIIAYGFALILLIIFEAPGCKFKHVSRLIILVLLVVMADFVSRGRIFGETVSRFLELSSGFEEAGGYRSAEISVAMPFVSSHCLLGMGLGFLKVLYIDGMGVIQWGGFIHNAYVELLLKTGMLGTITAAVLVFTVLGLVYNGGARAKDIPNDIRLLCRGSIISAVSWLLVYMAAPVSTFGPIFTGLMISVIAIKCSEVINKPRQVVSW